MIGILGGTFDPIHYGHLRIAIQIVEQLSLKQLYFVPCQQPVFQEKKVVASAQQRLEMVRLAIEDEPYFVINESELKRSTPSYTLDTLKELKANFNSEPLALILGSDTYSQIHRWHDYEKLSTLVHLVIIPREFEAFNLDFLPPNYLAIKNSLTLYTKQFGYVWIAHNKPLPISSTWIRKLIQNHQSARYLLPDSVLSYIRKEKLYRDKNNAN